MKKRFIVVVSRANPAQDEAFRQFIKSQGFAWWHWLPTLWLLTDAGGGWDAANIRDKTVECYTGAQVFVEELDASGNNTWAGWGPKSESRNMFHWLQTNWK